MFIEFYYFPFVLEQDYKINTLVNSLIFDLEKFYLYHFNKKLNKQDNHYYQDNIDIFVSDSDNMHIPKIIFQYDGKLSKLELDDLLSIFSSYGEEKFIINYDGFKLKGYNFLELLNVDKFILEADKNFELFIKKYSKIKVLDETDKIYKKFRQNYSLFLYLYYLLVKTYKDLNIKNKEVTKIHSDLEEYTAHIKLLGKRIDLDKKSIEKTIITYELFLQKIIKILKYFDNKS